MCAFSVGDSFYTLPTIRWPWVLLAHPWKCWDSEQRMFVKEFHLLFTPYTTILHIWTVHAPSCNLPRKGFPCFYKQGILIFGFPIGNITISWSFKKYFFTWLPIILNCNALGMFSKRGQKYFLTKKSTCFFLWVCLPMQNSWCMLSTLWNTVQLSSNAKWILARRDLKQLQRKQYLTADTEIRKLNME